MDTDDFGALLRSFSTSPSRRTAVRLLTGSALGGLLTVGVVPTAAKKKKKKKKPCPTCPAPTSTRCPTPTPVTVSCPGPNQISATGTFRHAQTFTAPNSGQVIAAQVELVGGAAGNDYTLDIRTLDNTGKPSGTVLASKRIENAPAASTSVPVALIANFAPFAPVQAGTGYALAVTVDPTQGMSVSTRSSSDACPGQRFFDTFADGNFAPTSGDLIFSVTIVV
jgi:hypothetical protein